MGYDQQNAGIHLVPYGYKGSSDSFQAYDKYGAIIAENHIKEKQRDKNILDDVKLCNFIFIADRRGQLKHCLCGGKIIYKENIILKFHRNGKICSLKIDGKQCVDCERKIVIKDELLSKMKEIYQK